jgi:hypothetical protein
MSPAGHALTATARGFLSSLSLGSLRLDFQARSVNLSAIMETRLQLLIVTLINNVFYSFIILDAIFPSSQRVGYFPVVWCRRPAALCTL